MIIQAHIYPYLDLLLAELIPSEQLHALFPGQTAPSRMKRDLKPLRSILQDVGQHDAGTYFFKPQKLYVWENLLASSERLELPADWNKPALAEWEQLVTQFGSRTKNPTLGDYNALAYSAYHLAYAYGSRVACQSDTSFDDASLFDYNRIAAAKYLCHQAPGTATDQPYLLVKGDISGIQDYIYHEISAEQIGDAERVAKRLRGRSFFIALMSDTLAEWLVDELNLGLANILYSGGGNFQLLLPNNEVTTNQLYELERQINRDLRRRMQPAPSLLLAQCPISTKDLSNFGAANTKLGELLEQEKQRRARLYLNELFVAEKPEKDPPQYDGHTGLLRQNHKLIEKLGQTLPYADYLLEVHVKAEERLDFQKMVAEHPALVISAFAGQGIYYFQKCDRKEGKGAAAYQGILDAYAHRIDRVRLIRINQSDFLEGISHFEQPNHPTGFGFKYIAKAAPVKAAPVKKDEGQLQTFDEIAKRGHDLGNKELAYDRIGVIRLDVDDLGAVFAAGLGSSQTFERLSALSRELQLFFAGYMDHLAQRFNMYVIYSGGDDAFLLGSWYDAHHFLRELRRDFERFTCHNPHLGFSAGLFICSPYYPVARFYKDAGDLEADAKKDAPGKNRIKLYGRILPWARYLEMMDIALKMTGLVMKKGDLPQKEEKGKFRRSMILRLLRFITAGKKQGDDFETFRTLARLHYLFGRHEIDARHILSNFLNDYSKDSDKAHDYAIPFNYVFHLSKEGKNEKVTI
ncbi:MAG TPA: hypothetical protein PKA00_01360 [Saprospiraceae bacterium]|nr:hypothetical protein [Saprospiraceae bacterium]HMQ81516.1 hypothetical protein [Saprospiraceae bacterium]